MSDVQPTAPGAAEPAKQAAPRRARWRVALLGLIGAVALVLPLAQVLRFQVQALTEDRAERLRLDPLAEALTLHQGLAGHDAVATRVLRGRHALEGERRSRQAQVDQSLVALQATLWAGDWPQARREAAGLQAGWRELASSIEQRRIAVDASQQGHRLLQEQAVQVMDFVGAGLRPQNATVQLMATLPRAQWPALVQARQQELGLRIERAESTRGLVLSALAAVLAAAAWAGLAALTARLRRRARGPVAPASTPGRRAHGRRVGDHPPLHTPAAIAAQKLQALRRSVENESSRG